jgi:H+-transporting ATPase
MIVDQACDQLVEGLDMSLVEIKSDAPASTKAEQADSGSGAPRRLDAASIAAKFNELKTSSRGLTAGEAAARLAKAGPNAIVAKEEPLGRVFPEHKYEIVKSLQETGHIVAMTGDGVNDAPALKQADCGIAVSGATDAARSAAALILTTPGLSTIINAIDEARKIFERITSYVYYRIAMTIAIMLVVVMSSVIFNIQPLTAIMIVVLALLDDIPIMTIAYDNVRMASTPVRWNMHKIIVFSGLMGLMATAQSFGLVLFGMELMSWIHLDHAHLQTMLFLQLAAGGHMLLFVVRSRRAMILPPWPSAPLFLAVVATQIVAVLLCAYGVLAPALPWPLIGIVWLYVIGWTILTDIVKLIFNAANAPEAPQPLNALAMAIRQ